MIRGLVGRMLVPVILAACAVACVGLMSGCSSSRVDTAPPPPVSSSSKAKVAASGPAISTSLTFDQLALGSPVQRVTNKNGLVFLHFSYANRDGNVYKCELPQAMSKGSYPYDEWIRTFSIYKLPQVVAKKSVTKKGHQTVGGFPFIAPRPQRVEAPKQPQGPGAAPAGMPTLPPMPTPPPASQPPARPFRGS